MLSIFYFMIRHLKLSLLLNCRLYSVIDLTIVCFEKQDHTVMKYSLFPAGDKNSEGKEKPSILLMIHQKRTNLSMAASDCTVGLVQNQPRLRGQCWT